MHIDELIEELEKVKEEHGNQPIHIHCDNYSPYTDNLDSISIEETSWDKEDIIIHL